jgi:hypothetical protein
MKSPSCLQAALLSAGLLSALLSVNASASTVLEYEVDGTCATDFTRMSFDGLYARFDHDAGGAPMSTIFDDSEQLMYVLMHDSRNVMTMESDDDAIDFQSDVGRSTMLYAGKQTEKVTGMDQNQMIAQAQAAQVAACPELAEMGFSDPDYAAAAERCAQKMSAMPSDPQAQREMAEAMLESMNGGGKSRRAKPAAAPAEPLRWVTTSTEADGTEQQIAGMTCRDETTRRGDTVLRRQCVVEVDALQLEASAMRRLKRIVKVGEGISAGISSLNPEANPDAGQPAKVALQRTCFEQGNRTGTATLRIKRDAPIDESIFAVPAGYEPLEISMPGED